MVSFMGSCLRILCPLLLVSVLSGQEGENKAADPLDEAIAALRGIEPAKLSRKEQEAVAGRIETAWKALQGAGEGGLERLRREISKVIDGKDKDEFFKLNAAALLWRWKQLEEASTIARLFQTSDLACHYRYVFLVTFAAALTGDKRAEPILLAILKNRKGEFYVVSHGLNLRWPLNHMFLWGVYGPKGQDALVKTLKESDDPEVLKSALYLVGQGQYLAALPHVRRLLKHKDPELVKFALHAIGDFAHPDDLDTVLAGLKSKNADKLWGAAYAAVEYEEERAVPLLIPLLKSPAKDLRQEVIVALSRIPTDAGIEALRDFVANHADKDEISMARHFLKRGAELLAMLKNPKRTAKPVQGDRKARFEEMRRKLHEKAPSWIKNNRLGSNDDCTALLSAATSADLDLVRRIRAACLRRLSDECLYEVRDLDRVIKRLGRCRY